jgi:hypothetical protein
MKRWADKGIGHLLVNSIVQHVKSVSQNSICVHHILNHLFSICSKQLFEIPKHKGGVLKLTLTCPRHIYMLQ